MKLWRCEAKASITVYILSENQPTADDIEEASRAHGSRFKPQDREAIAPVAVMDRKQVHEAEWLDSFPYGYDGTLTIRELFDEEDARIAALRATPGTQEYRAALEDQGQRSLIEADTCD